jgi:hypothetical protein
VPRPAPTALLLLVLPLLAGAGPAERAVAAARPRLVAEASGRLAVAVSGRVETLAPAPEVRVRSVAADGDGWMAAGTRVVDGAADLWIGRGDGRRWRDLALPAERRGAERAGPELLAADGRVAGLAWLEGDAHDRLAVRFAAFDGERLGPAVTIAPPGPGSQLALAGAVLADGRLLLSWAGFDGRDDEIWVAIRSGTAWSAPARVAEDNQVPDVAPAVVATADGAFVAWSRFDGSEYRVALARWSGGGRPAPTRWAAEPGTLFPTFESDGGALGLLYQDARAGAWVVAELGRDGAPLRTARFAGTDDSRPVLRMGERGVRWSAAGVERQTAWQ